MDSMRRRDEILPTNWRTVTNVVSWVLLALVITTLIARFAVKLSRRTTRRILLQDDVFLLLAAFFSFGQTVAISIQWTDEANHPLPRKDVYNKAAYASSILFIANMGCAKISLSLVMRKLFSGRLFEYTSTILALFTAGWTISGILVTAFQCQLPAPWNLSETDGCIDIAAFGNYLASMNIATEVLLVLIPLAIWIRGSSVGNRLYVSAAFVSRLSVIAAVSAQLYFFNLSMSSPSTHSNWNTTLCMQIAQTLSVISACLPGLHPLIAKDLHNTPTPQPMHNATHWDTKKFGSVSSHSSQQSTTSQPTHPATQSPSCHSLTTHGLTHATRSLSSSPHPPPSQPIFNRLISTSTLPSSPLDMDPLGIPGRDSALGCLPAPASDADTSGPERRPSSAYRFSRSKVISVLVGGSEREGGDGWKGFVPPVASPRGVAGAPWGF